jgi:hypothetical protein
VASLQGTLGRQNGLSQRFIDKAQQLASVDGGLLLEQVAAAKDGTTKLVFKLTEGEGAGGNGFCAVKLICQACSASREQQQRHLVWVRLSSKRS